MSDHDLDIWHSTASAATSDDLAAFYEEVYGDLTSHEYDAQKAAQSFPGVRLA